MASSTPGNSTAKEQESNYGRMVAVGPPTLDTAILRRNIRLAVTKLTNSPWRAPAASTDHQELERKDKDSNQLSTQPTQNFVVETASAEQALPPSLPTGHQGSEFRIRNEKSMIELGKLPESPSGRGPQTGRSIHVNLLVDRKSRQSQQQRPTTKVDGEKLGLLYTIHENKDGGSKSPERAVQRPVPTRPLQIRSPISRSAVRTQETTDKAVEAVRGPLWQKYRHGAWLPKKLESTEDKTGGSTSIDLVERSHGRSDSRKRLQKPAAEQSTGRRDLAGASGDQALPTGGRATPRSQRGEPVTKPTPVQSLSNASAMKPKNQLVRVQSVQQPLRKKAPPTDVIEPRLQLQRPISSQKIPQLEIQSKQKREESSKNKSQLPVRASPVIARKPSGPLHANASGLVDRPAEMKDSGLLIRMQRPKTRAATTGQLISKSAGFGKLKKNFLGLDLPVVDSDNRRKYSQESALLNLMYGLVMRNRGSNNYVGTNDIHFNVCSGNNGTLVEGMIRGKKYTTHENMYHKSQIQWSQTHHKNLAPSAIAGIPKIPIRELGNIDEYKDLPLSDPNELAKLILDTKLFKVDLKKVSLSSLFGMVLKNSYLGCGQIDQVLVCNHLQGVTSIAHKTKLTETILRFAKARKIDPFCIIPKTWTIRLRTAEHDIEKILTARKGVDWRREPVIVKPGENTNRGVGITMGYTPEESFQSALSLLRSQKGVHTIIVQAYITNPLLYKKRKFDIRCYGLIVKYSNRTFYFWYNDGYARTSSYEFSVDCKHNLMVHLTNEAVQVKGNLAVTRSRSIRSSGAREQSVFR